jgi:hypothetical protein
VDYFPSPYCNACPCAACGSSSMCCPLGTGGAICVMAAACPG